MAAVDGVNLMALPHAASSCVGPSRLAKLSGLRQPRQPRSEALEHGGRETTCARADAAAPMDQPPGQTVHVGCKHVIVAHGEAAASVVVPCMASHRSLYYPRSSDVLKTVLCLAGRNCA